MRQAVPAATRDPRDPRDPPPPSFFPPPLGTTEVYECKSRLSTRTTAIGRLGLTTKITDD
jgi:hypothetical protein